MVFGQAGFNVFAVASSSVKFPLKTAMGLKVTPAYDLDEHPHPEIIVIPGGREFDVVPNAGEIAWMQKHSGEAEHVLSVCCGSVELGRAGLLDGLSATTHHNYYDDLEAHTSKVCTVKDKRWVDNGKIVTSGGICSGIDGALYVVSKIKGIDESRRIAKWMEYNWSENAER